MTAKLDTAIGPYAVVPEWLVSAVTPQAVRVWVYLWLRADRTSDECWPSVPTIARALEISTRTVQRALVRLEASGAVRRTRRKTDHGDYTSNLYLLDPTNPATRMSPPGVMSVTTNPPSMSPPGGDTDGSQTRARYEQESNDLEGGATRISSSSAEKKGSNSAARDIAFEFWNRSDVKPIVSTSRHRDDLEALTELVDRVLAAGNPPDAVARGLQTTPFFTAQALQGEIRKYSTPGLKPPPVESYRRWAAGGGAS